MMNAYAALLAGTGGVLPASNGTEPGPSQGKGTGATAGNTEPDFFVVLQGTLGESSPAASSKVVELEDGILAENEVKIDLEVQIDPEVQITPEPRVEPEPRLGLDRETSVEPRVAAEDPVPQSAHAVRSDGAWLGSAEEGDDRIPLLEIDGPASQPRLPLEVSGPGGGLDAPAQPLDASLLYATLPGGSPNRGDTPDIKIAPPTPRLRATVGDGTPLSSGSRPTPEAPDKALLASTPPDGSAAATSTPAVIADPDLSLVDPELRVRLGRVIERMRSEYGHNVKVVEGFRTAERQNALFAQGRTTPGQVVTWTQNSLHSEGLAVDVIVDGSYAPHEGYRRLAQIAQQEGLETLGPKDPGHLQLTNRNPESDTRGERFARVAEVETVATPARQSPVAQPARVALRASTAEPAVVAQPAVVGRPAEVALAGSGGVPIVTEGPELAGDRVALTSTDGNATDPLSPSPNGTATDDRTALFGQRERTRALAQAALRRERASVRSDTSGTRAVGDADPRFAASASVDPGATGQSGSTATGAVKEPSMVPADSLHRVTQVRELQELAYPKKLGQVTLRMLDGMSEEARMRVSLATDGVRTSIGVRDLAQAARMRSRIGTLEQALRQRGLDPISTRVTAIAGATAADGAALTAQAVQATRLPAETETFLNWTGSGSRSDAEDADETFEPRDPRQQPQEHKQEKRQ